MSGTSLERKARGAFFTPPELANFIAEWAIRDRDDRVLEPSVGEGDFLLAAAGRLHRLGSPNSDRLRGVELHAPSAARAVERVGSAGSSAVVAVQSFFDLPATPSYDAVVGNPPYIRYQDFKGRARAQALTVALENGVRLSGLASSWASFVVHAAQFLTPEGRLGLVLPAELLGVKYAAEVRRFLLRRFARVHLVLFEDLVFPGVQEEVVLLLAEGAGPTKYFQLHQVRSLENLANIAETAWIPYVPDGEEKWLQGLVSSDALDVYRKSFDATEGFATLGSWGTTYLGAVTGNNGFFTLTQANASSRGIPTDELLPISPPGSRHLRELAFAGEHWTSLAADQKPCWLFHPSSDAPSEGAKRYIEEGARLGVDGAYKCRVRRPWWRVPLVRPPDLFLTYMDRERPRLVTNRMGAHHLNSVYGVSLRPEARGIGADLLPVAALNSITLLGSELVGRAYGGGLLKLEPREADHLPLPSLDTVHAAAGALSAVRPHVNAALREGRLMDAVRVVDRILLRQHARLSEGEIQKVRAARQTLYQRRITRSGKRNAAD